MRPIARPRLSTAALLALTMMLTALLAAGPVVAQEPEAALRERLAQVQREREAVGAELQRATAELDELTTRVERVRQQSEDVRTRIAELQAELESSREAIDSYARELYRGEAGSTWMQAFGSRPQDVGDRGHYLTAVARRQQEAVERAAAAEAELTQESEELTRLETELVGLQAEAQAGAEELNARLAAAGDTERELQDELRRREEEARRLAAEAEARRQAQEDAAAAEAAAAQAQAAADEVRSVANPPRASNGMACPQDQPRSFTDTFGAPRGGGTRSHQGTDIFGQLGGDVFAITDGVIEFTRNGATSGLFISLEGDDGHTYWYMHLQSFGASAGQRVSAGQRIGANGQTGNAQGTTPHIHFEYHPGGGGAVNPFPLLRSVCG